LDVSLERIGEVPLARVSGRVDHANAEAFRGALAPVLTDCCHGAVPLVMDLSRLEYISSAGLRILMLAARQVAQQGGTLLLAAPQPVVRQILRISRFDLLFRIRDTLDEALAEARAPAEPGS
jgi:anti-anti-sigma factor